MMPHPTAAPPPGEQPRAGEGLASVRVPAGLVVAFWLVVAVAVYSRPILMMAVRRPEAVPMLWFPLLQIVGAKLVIWLAGTPLMLAVARRWPLTRGRWAAPLAVHVVVALALAVVNVTAAWVVRDRAYGQPSEFLPYFYTYFQVDLYLYLLAAALYHVVRHYADARRRELRAARLEAEVAAAELESVKMQLDPVFLFSVLDAVRARIRTTPRDADVMVGGLGELMREVVGSLGVPLVPLSDELYSLERYLELAEARAADGLEFEARVEPGTREALVPPFLLQAVFEDLLRARPVDGGTVRLALRAREAGGSLRLGIWVGPPARSAGAGLATVRDRLAKLYAGGWGLRVRGGAGGVYVALRLPLGAEPEELPLAVAAEGAGVHAPSPGAAAGPVRGRVPSRAS